MELPTFSLKFYFSTQIPKETADYDANGNLLYEGMAVQGTPTSAGIWMIKKHFYQQVTIAGATIWQWIGSRTMQNQIWDNRASITFLTLLFGLFLGFLSPALATVNQCQIIAPLPMPVSLNINNCTFSGPDLPAGSTGYIQNTLSPTTTGQQFSVQDSSVSHSATLGFIGGTQCLHTVNGAVSGTGSECGSGGGVIVSSYIFNQSTLQSGSTAYPDFLYVATSGTIGSNSRTFNIPAAVFVSSLPVNSTTMTIVIENDTQEGVNEITGIDFRMPDPTSGAKDWVQLQSSIYDNVTDGGSAAFTMYARTHGTMQPMFQYYPDAFNDEGELQSGFVFGNEGGPGTNGAVMFIQSTGAASYFQTSARDHFVIGPPLLTQSTYLDINHPLPDSDSGTQFVNLGFNGEFHDGFIQWSDAGNGVAGSSFTINAPLRVSGANGLLVDYQVNAGSMTGAGLSSCSGTSNALTWNSGTHLFGCNSISSGSGSSLAVGTGTISGWAGIPASSPTFVINFDQSQFSATLQGGGTSYVTIEGSIANPTASYTIGSSVTVVLANCGSACTVTLPTAVGISGKVLRVKVVGTGIVTIGTTSAQTIDGNATVSPLPNQWADIDVSSDGANWNIL